MGLYFAGKADKKAAQAKIQQQEHKRQVCFNCSCLLLLLCVWFFLGSQKRWLSCPISSHYCICFTGARRRATSHGTQNTHEVGLCMFVLCKQLCARLTHGPFFRERERREKERDEWERQYGRQSSSPSPSKYGKTVAF